MTEKPCPLSRPEVDGIVERFPTPFHFYEEERIRETARRFSNAFAWVPGGYRNYFAVKALPNPHVMRVLHEEGMGFDCSSLPELLLCEQIGVTREELFFTSNDTPAEEFREARRVGARINLDDISHIPFLERVAGIPEFACIRYNPGPLREGNAIIGSPEEAKYGFTRDQVIDGYRLLQRKGVRRFGLHTMVASNELNPDYFIETARMVFELAAEIHERLGIRIELVNLGGGIGIPYRPDQDPADIEYVSNGIRKLYGDIVVQGELDPLAIAMENGRCITGPHGYLVSRVRHTKQTYKQFVGLDATMADLMRPGMYGAYHHISVPGKEHLPLDEEYDVTGSLCENNDKFAIDRKLPKIEVGDYVVIHDTGAHGHAMGFNYNGKLRAAELLRRPDGSVHRIRRAETVEDYFATLDFTQLDAEG